MTLDFVEGSTMPKKHQPTHKGSKPNLGQNEAKREKKSEVQLRQMKGERASRSPERSQEQKGKSHGKPS
jgi:hypothetical protein